MHRNVPLARIEKKIQFRAPKIQMKAVLNPIISALFAGFCLFVIPVSSSAQATPEKGKAIFKKECKSCHNANMKSDMTGPALGGAEERWENEEDLYSWIKNSQAMVASGHPRAVAIFNQWNKSVMTTFTHLSDEDIASVLLYVNAVVDGGCGMYPCPVGGAGPVAAEEKATPSWIYGALVGLLAILALILSRVVSNMNYMVGVKDGSVTGKRPSILQAFTSKSVIGFLLLALIVGAAFTLLRHGISFGRQEGYAPQQPIAFSHAVHAGIHEIDCQYCHDGARRSKHAVIPAVNTCMNCHTAVAVGNHTEGTKEWENSKAEIQKIYDAAGWDPKTQSYSGETKPIKWVRIHNLPDHVWFSHAQHVSVGGVECQTCHGPVEEMDVVHQHSPLSMGWCINCHRETEVQFASNPYYESWENYHDDLKEGKIDKVTVEGIGGLECQKCHY